MIIKALGLNEPKKPVAKIKLPKATEEKEEESVLTDSLDAFDDFEVPAVKEKAPKKAKKEVE
jgi:hypothetical protein